MNMTDQTEQPRKPGRPKSTEPKPPAPPSTKELNEKMKTDLTAPKKRRGYHRNRKGQVKRSKKSPQRMNLFLKALHRNNGNVSKSAKAAGVCKHTVYQWRSKDEIFAQRWDIAVDEVMEVMEEEAYRRAVQGVEKPIFYKGQEIGTIKEYSDRLLEFMLSAKRGYARNTKTEHTGPGGGPLQSISAQITKEMTEEEAANIYMSTIDGNTSDS